MNMPELLTFKEAQKTGAIRYFTGKPCLQGHVSERYVSSKRCIMCDQARYEALHSTPEWKARALSSAARWRKKNPERYRECRARWIADPRKTMLYASKYRARKRGLEWDLRLDDIKMPTDGRCPVFGTALVVVRGRKVGPNSPSLDRIDSSRGYVPDNIRVISYRANTLKSNATPEEIRGLYYSQTMRRHEPVVRDWLYV